MNRTLQALLLLLLSLTASGQGKKTVSGEYVMLVPENISREEARAAAVEQAKLEALAKEFGTMVSQTNILLMEEENNRSRNSFYSLGQCDVKGEWIKTTEENVDEAIADGQHWMTARVKGVAREVRFAKVDFESHLLRNGKGDEFEADDYRDGDRFYISFRSPAKGYLAVYLLDADRNAFPIVPEQNEELFQVKRGERYVFVDDDEHYIFLTTDRPQELNQVYIIFSPNKFYPENVTASQEDKALERYRTEEYNNVSRLPYVPLKKFQKWLSRLRDKDPEVQVVTKYIKITGRE